jgi:transposase
MDVHKDSISVGILAPEDDVPEVEKILHDEASIRRLVGRFGDPGSLVACYEAGPTGYELHRLLVGMGLRCEVVAPSLIPRTASDRVKTDLLTESRPGPVGVTPWSLPAASGRDRARVKVERPQAKPRTNDLDPGEARPIIGSGPMDLRSQ